MHSLEITNLNVSIDGQSILKDFSLTIPKGQIHALMGPNGTGKTTLLRLILNELKADKGSIKINKNIEFSYFDQNRSDLKPKDTLKDVMVPNGGDYIEVRGKMRHVYGCLLYTSPSPRDNR